ncbi:MAG: glycine-rich domain-containing protein [Mongoliitalea sp.]
MSFLIWVLSIVSVNGYAQTSNQVVTIFRITEPTTFILPPHPNPPLLADDEQIDVEVKVYIIGAGGGGGRGEGAGGGGGGAVDSITYTNPTIKVGDRFIINPGTGGAPGTPNGGKGGNTTFQIENLPGTLITTAGGEGGQGGNSGRGGNSGNGNVGGNSPAPQGNGGNIRRAGGGGAGASKSTEGNIEGNGQNGQITNTLGIGGNGGAGIIIAGFEYAGGGGATARGNGNLENSGNSTVGNGSINRSGNSKSAGNGSLSNGENGVRGGGGGGGQNSGGNGGNGEVVIIVTYRIGIGLPVEFQNFEASFDAQNRLSILNWATAKEWENSHFEIERAIDQVKSFETIGETAGVGFSDEVVNYSFEDKHLPLAGGMAYYRLKQVDFDGTHVYSDVVGVKIPASTQKGSNAWKAFPNPNKGGERFNLELVNRSAYADEMVIVKLVSPVGKQEVFSGKDVRQLSDSISQAFQKSTNGLYIVEVAWGSQKEQMKIMKQ